jgi:hypothetical protein
MLDIGGKSASDLLQYCTSFSYKQSKAKAAETKLVFRNDDRKLLDDPRTFPNTAWLFRFGFFEDLSPITLAYVREVAPVYADRRIVTFTLFDSSLNMSAKSSAKNWGKIPSSEIAKAIAKNHGFSGRIDDSNDKPAKAFVQPQAVNDIQYLRDLAALIDFEVYVDGSPAVLYYCKKQYDRAPKKTLIYYDDPGEYGYVLSFTPKVKGLGPMNSGVSATSKDGKEAKGAKTADGDGKTPALGGHVVRLGMVNGTGSSMGVYRGGEHVQATVVTVKDKGVSKGAPSGAKTSQLVQAYRHQILDQANEASSEHPLTPSIRIGEIYEWAGIEKQLSGKWYVQEVTHEISGNKCSTKVTWKRNAKGKGDGKTKNQNNKKGEGDIAKVPGVIIRPDQAPVYRPGGIGSFNSSKL